jgi:outer membrane lipoprotein-sorting protein
MPAQPFLARHRALRWLAPVGVLGIAGLAATGVFNATASPDDLPSTTPAALIAAAQTTEVDGFSGTVVSRLSLGLPELPALANTREASSFASLLTGSHTLQVWYGGATKQRVALLGPTDEMDLFRNGRDMWQWSSADQVAVHTVVPAGDPTPAAPPTFGASLTPGDLARSTLRSLDPTTRVEIKGKHTVADRSAYVLVLTPRTSATKIGSVHIAIDGETKTPLGVQVYARNASAPAVDIAFTSIRFASPAQRNFVFSPPPNATVHEAVDSGRSPAAPHPGVGANGKPKITGSGWARVVTLRPGPAAMAKLPAAVRKVLTPVSGAWGKGRLLESSLLSVLVTDDGRLLAGAVAPDQLYAAAGSR